MKKILVISAHPDDEVLGCSGFICKQKSEGNRVFVLYLSEGVTSREDTFRFNDRIRKEIENRKKNGRKSIKNFKI